MPSPREAVATPDATPRDEPGVGFVQRYGWRGTCALGFLVVGTLAGYGLMFLALQAVKSPL